MPHPWLIDPRSMCGISGLVGPGSAADLQHQAGAMASQLAHRGPDGTGTWADAAAGIALGHRRLAVIGLGEAGAQPMASPGGRWQLVFNGEVYNWRALARELGLADVRSDTAVLAAALDRWGFAATLPKLDAMLALAAWDSQSNTLWLARDRMGEKPLYVGTHAGRVLFASELKACRALPWFKPSLDHGAMALFLRHSAVPAPHCIWAGMQKLRPGHLMQLQVTEGQARLGPQTPWFDARAAVQAARAEPLVLSDAAATERVEQVLLEAVGSRMHADVPLGAFLSGGIDSSLVAALMQRQADQPVRTFTMGFAEQGWDERPHAAAVAAHLGTDHTELEVSPADALAVVPDLPDLYDEPFADASQIPTVLVSRLARSRVTVALSGDGGDELFGGYNRYTWGRRVWQWLRLLPPPVWARLAAGCHGVPMDRWDAMHRRLAPVLPRRLAGLPRVGERVHKVADIMAAGSLSGMYRLLLSHWLPVHGLWRADTPNGVPAEPATNLDDPAWQVPGLEPVAHMMFMDSVTYLPDDILAKVDRAAMAVGLETRVPLLHPALFHLAWQLPAAQKIRGGDGKWLLREVLARHVPRALFERPKMGFGVPVGPWLRGPLREWAGDLLATDRLQRQGLFDPAVVQAAWQDHQAGRRNQQGPLWDLLMLQAWLDRWA